MAEQTGRDGKTEFWKRFDEVVKKKMDEKGRRLGIIPPDERTFLGMDLSSSPDETVYFDPRKK